MTVTGTVLCMRLRTGRDSWDCGRKLTRDLKQGPGTENTSPGIFRSMHPFNRSQEMLSAYVVAPRVSFICLFCCAVAWRFSVREGRGVWATSLGAPGVCWRPRQCPLLIMMMVPAQTLVPVARYYPTPPHRPVCFSAQRAYRGFVADRHARHFDFRVLN